MDFEEKIRQELDRLGIRNIEFQNEQDAPPVDRQAIRQLVDNELPNASASLVCQFIERFKSWRDAHVEILLERLKAQNTTDDFSDPTSPKAKKSI